MRSTETPSTDDAVPQQAEQTAPAGTWPDTAAPARSGTRARRIRALRLNSAAICVMLIAEYGLGIGVNLYVEVPPSDQHRGLATALGRVLTNQPVTLAIHGALGLLLLVAAVSVLTRAILARQRFAFAAAAVGLLAIAGAAVSGATFVNGNKAAASMAMATLTGVALLCYVASLLVVTPKGTAQDRT